MESPAIRVRLPQPLKDALDAHVVESGESVSSVVVRALAEELGVTVEPLTVGRPALTPVADRR